MLIKLLIKKKHNIQFLKAKFGWLVKILGQIGMRWKKLESFT